MSRPGKIAKLPRPIQDELNRRLEKNVPGRQLAAWLNALPEVQSVLNDYFEGEPINEQNISNWRTGGFEEWLYRQDFLNLLRQFSADTAEVEAALRPMAAHSVRLLSLKYSLTLSAGETSGLDLKKVSELKPLYDLTRAVNSLRRLEQHDKRLQIEELKALHKAGLPIPAELAETVTNSVRNSFTANRSTRPPAAKKNPKSRPAPVAATSRSKGKSRPFSKTAVPVLSPSAAAAKVAASASIRSAAKLQEALHQGKSRPTPQPSAPAPAPSRAAAKASASTSTRSATKPLPTANQGQSTRSSTPAAPAPAPSRATSTVAASSSTLPSPKLPEAPHQGKSSHLPIPVPASNPVPVPAPAAASLPGPTSPFPTHPLFRAPVTTLPPLPFSAPLTIPPYVPEPVIPTAILAGSPRR